MATWKKSFSNHLKRLRVQIPKCKLNLWVFHLKSQLPFSLDICRDFFSYLRSSFSASNSEIKSCWFKFVICDVMYMQTRKLKNLPFTIKRFLSFTSNLHNFQNAPLYTERISRFHRSCEHSQHEMQKSKFNSKLMLFYLFLII